MKVRHFKPGKPDGWDQLEVTAEPGRRLWIDSQVIDTHKIRILEGPEERGGGHAVSEA